ncbi:MAG TPA: AMP-binding protein [Acidobacteriaceae bacterium]
MQVEQFLERSAARFPDKVALVCGSERFTYAQIDGGCNRLAQSLLEAGVQRGDRVVVFLPNSPEAVLAIFAILKAGAVFVVLNPTTKADKLIYILNNCRASAMISRGGLAGLNGQVWSATPHLHSVFMLDAGATQGAAITAAGKKLFSLDELRQNSAPGAQPAKRCIDIDLAGLIYTSGSTGRPKGVMVTHLNVVSAATSITAYLENTADDVVINFLPLAFDYGLYQLLMMFRVGGTLVLQDSFVFPNLVLESIAREGVTGLPIVPTVSAILLQMDLSRFNFPKLRYISNTAAALPVEHIQKLRALFPHVRLYSMYGLTECKRVSYLPPDQLDLRPTSVGRGMPNEEVYIVDENGHRVAPGVVGELVVRGANVMKGYWELPEETERCLRPGPLPGEKVLYSGDLFRADEEGYLYFVGRRDDIIKTRGEKVSPREVEDVIYMLEGVAEVGVIGIPDPVLGSAIKAIISLRPGSSLTEKDVLRHCASRLEDFMRPKLIAFQQSLPKTESGKISKRLLREEEHAREGTPTPVG